MKAAQFANTDAGERLGATVALLEAAIPDPFQRLAIINAIVDYGTERALEAIDSMAERWRKSIDRKVA